eukprot:scaffold9235_cov31-Tisochrysis_lutea.AAC.2
MSSQCCHKYSRSTLARCMHGTGKRLSRHSASAVRLRAWCPAYTPTAIVCQTEVAISACPRYTVIGANICGVVGQTRECMHVVRSRVAEPAPIVPYDAFDFASVQMNDCRQSRREHPTAVSHKRLFMLLPAVADLIGHVDCRQANRCAARARPAVMGDLIRDARNA